MTVRTRRSFAAKRRQVRAKGGRCDWCGFENCRNKTCAEELAEMQKHDLVCGRCWPTPCSCRRRKP